MSRYLVAMSLAGVLAGGLSAACSARAAETPSDAPSLAVQIYRSELSSRAGIARLHDRLEEAAREVCHSLDSRELERQMRYRHCVAQALERAVRDVHDARLSAYHRGKAGAMRTAGIVAESAATGHRGNPR